MERSNFSEAWRSDRLAEIQKSLEVLDGPLEMRDNDVRKVAYSFDNRGDDVGLNFDLRRHLLKSTKNKMGARFSKRL